MLGLRRALLGAMLLLLLIPAAADAQATRTFVSGTGDDVQPCSRTAPCRTFAGAISKTATNGIINSIDAGAYGTVNITKGLTIEGIGEDATVLVTSNFTGVTVNAPGADVILRNLQITGTGACGAGRGINLIDARSLTISNLTIDGVSVAGIQVAPATGDTSVNVRDSEISNGCNTGDGIVVAPGGTFAAKALLDNVTLYNLDVGLSVADRGRAWLTTSTIFDNTTGLVTTGTGEIHDLGGNAIVGNDTNGTPTTAAPAGAQGPAGVDGTDGTNGTNGADGTDGAAGPAGPAGPAGREGVTGPTGPAGPDGATGPEGEAGPRGPEGRIGKVKCRLKGKRKIKCKVRRAAGSSARVLAARSLGGRRYRVTLQVGARTVRRTVRV